MSWRDTRSTVPPDSFDARRSGHVREVPLDRALSPARSRWWVSPGPPRNLPRRPPPTSTTIGPRQPPAGPRRRAGAAAAEPRHAHVSGVDDEAAGAALHQPGPEPRLRLQPRRGAAAPSARRRVSIPNLAMAYWGQALVLGPNINAAMEPNEEPHAYELMQKAHVARRQGARRASGRSSTRWPQRYSGKRRRPRRQRRGLRRRDARRAPAVPRRPRHRDALRRVDDGPAAVGLLDARRPRRTTAPPRSSRSPRT